MCDEVALQLLIGQSTSIDWTNSSLSENASIESILSYIAKWIGVEFYLNCDNRIFIPTVHFIDATSYQTPSSNLTAGDFAYTLVGLLSKSVENRQTILDNFYDQAYYSKLFRFPTIASANEESVKLVLPLPTELDLDDPDPNLDEYIQLWLNSFYGESEWGSYTTGFNNEMVPLTNPSYLAGHTCSRHPI